MAKNKVYFMLALLAGFTVLCGCAGEGAGVVSKSAGNSMDLLEKTAEDLPPVTPVESTGDDKEKDGGKSPDIPPFPPSKPQELGTFPGLDVETERQLKLDYAHWQSWDTADYVRILHYFGNYNDCELVRMEGLADAAVVTKVSVAGMVFAFPNPNVTLVWKCGENPASGSFYRLNEAYDLVFLTSEDIKNLHKRHYEVFPFMEEFMKEPESPPMPDHLCDFYGKKIPTCTFEGCEW